MFGSILSDHKVIETDTVFSGIANAGLTVAPGVRLEMRGIVNGGLEIGAGAQVRIAGIVNGMITGDTTGLSGSGLVANKGI